MQQWVQITRKQFLTDQEEFPNAKSCLTQEDGLQALKSKQDRHLLGAL